jgi:quercetin dioxygenase-like cupin family protein
MSPNTVTEFQVKSLNSPDEKRRPPKSEIDVVTVGGNTLGRFSFEPGWRWSESIKPIAKTDSCQKNHVGFCLSGSIEVQLVDGTKATITSGDAYAIPAGHDAWVTGDEPFVGFEVESAATYATPPQ